MNWKEHAHLFTNGKFRLWDDQQGMAKRIVGSVNDQFLIDDEDFVDPVHYPIEWSTLIGRRIEDMTDEESRNVPSYKDQGFDLDYQKECMLDEAENIFEEASVVYDSTRVADFIYLLSIGVYPFDQQAFEDGTVIKAEDR